MSSRSTQQHHPPRLLVGRILLLITVLFSTASTPPARAQQSVDPGDEIAELAAQHQLDPTVVDAMLMAGMSAAQINPRSATLFAQERQLEPQVDPAKLLPATPGGAPQSPSARAGGTPIQTVALVMDGSGSIDANDFEIQRNGIRLAIQDPLLVPRDGTLALMVIQYAESFTQLEVPYRLIASDADANAVLAQIAGITQIQGSTNPGDGINAAAGQIQANATAADDTIICLSTDGLPNAGADVATALTSAQGAAVPLDTFSVIAIEDPGFYTAVDFHNFYDPLVFGGGAVSVVANSTEFASVLGATCFDNEPVNLIALEAVQVIQDWQDSVQLIANKATYVRAHFEPVGSDPVKVAARLHGRRGGAPLAGSPLSSINPGGVSDARLNAATRRAQFDQSLNFRLPDSWLTGTVELEIERVGGQANCQDNTDTANDCKVTVTFTPVAAPEVRFVRVSWTDTGGITHTPTDADIDEMIDRFRAIYPIASMVADRVSHTYAGTGVNLSTLNGQLATMRFTDFCWFTCDRIYYGVLVNSPVSGLANGIPGTVASGNLPGVNSLRAAIATLTRSATRWASTTR
ncbi:MAG: DUF1194 domain-containing protein [Caldilineaceae bacterium]